MARTWTWTWTWNAKRAAISAFLLVHLGAVGIWNLPPCAIKARGLDLSGRYLLPLGLWQYWGMFGPNPAQTTSVLEAAVVDNQGIMHRYAFPAMTERSPWQAVWGYRHSKFAANLGGEDFRVLREMAARHVVRRMGLPADDFPVVVQLFYQVSETPPPGTPPPDRPEAPKIAVIDTYKFPNLAEVLP